MTLKHYLLFVCFILGFSHFANGQRGWEIGGLAGVSYYTGDLNTSFDLTHPGLNLSAAARYNFDKRLCMKMGLNYGFISANDKYSSNDFEVRRNLHFRSNIFDFTGQVEFNFLPYTHGDTDEWFTPYVFTGFTVFKFNPQAKLGDEWIDLQPLGTEGQFRGEEYFTTKLAIPYGLGLKFDINSEWSVNFEIKSHYLFTDYLDDVSDSYPDKEDLSKLNGDEAVLLSDPSIPTIKGVKLGVLGRQRGNGKKNDTFTFVRVGVMYYFGGLRCPDILGR